MKTSLKLMKQQLQNITKIFDWNVENVANGQIMVFSGLNNIRVIINEIKTLDLFDDIISSLLESAIYTTANDQINVQTAEGKIIYANLTQLKILTTNFQNALLTSVPEEDINSINIKLPPVNDFDELSKVSRDIHIGLTQVILHEEINGQTRIVSVENGSIWINVFIGATALSLVASLAWSSAVIYKKIQEGRLLAEQVRGLKVKNDSLEDILKAQKEETSLMIQAEAEYISSEHFQESVPENIERIKNSISIFAELIAKGAEIHPALIAPENVSNLFPDPTKMIGVESKIKKLGKPEDN